MTVLYDGNNLSNKKIIKERIEGVFDMSKEKNGRKFLILLVTVFIVGSLFVVFGFNKLQFNLDSTNIHSLEYRLFDGDEMKEKEITNKEDLSKVIEYFNSLSLPTTLDRPKDGTNKFSFKDDNGNVIKEFGFGDSGVLWVGPNTYTLGSSNINTLKNLLRDM